MAIQTCLRRRLQKVPVKITLWRSYRLPTIRSILVLAATPVFTSFFHLEDAGMVLVRGTD